MPHVGAVATASLSNEALFPAVSGKTPTARLLRSLPLRQRSQSSYSEVIELSNPPIDDDSLFRDRANENNRVR